MKYCNRLLLLAVCLLMGLGVFSGYLQAMEPLPVELVPEIRERDLCPDLMESYIEQVQMTLFGGVSLEELGLDFDIWIAKMEGEPDQLFSETQWPENTDESYNESPVGMSIGMLTAFFDELLVEAWGEEWLELANQKAQEYADVTVRKQTYTIEVSEFENYTVEVVSPYLDIKTMELHEGTYVFVIQAVVSPELAMKFMELEDDEEEEEWIDVDQITTDYLLGEWLVETEEADIPLSIHEYLGSREEDGVAYEFYAGEVELFDQRMSVTSIPKYIYDEESFIMVGRDEEYATLEIYIQSGDAFFSFSGEIDNLDGFLEGYVLYGNSDEYYESYELDQMVRN